MKEKKTLIKYISIGLLSVIYFYLAINISCKLGYVTLSVLNASNLLQRFASDFMFSIIPVILILFFFRKAPDKLAISRKQPVLCIALLAVYLLCFILNGDFSAGGWYKFFFYLIVIASFEELWARSLLYLQLKPCGKTVAFIVSGLLFGAVHAIAPSVINSDGIGEMFLSMLSYLGFGLVGGLLFIVLLEFSETIFVPILIHAIMDYSPNVWIVLLALVGTAAWLIIVKIKEKSVKEDIL